MVQHTACGGNPAISVIRLPRRLQTPSASGAAPAGPPRRGRQRRAGTPQEAAIRL